MTFVVDAMNVQGGNAFFSRNYYTPELRVELEVSRCNS
jgi:hypothetical protein